MYVTVSTSARYTTQRTDVDGNPANGLKYPPKQPHHWVATYCLRPANTPGEVLKGEPNPHTNHWLRPHDVRARRSTGQRPAGRPRTRVTQDHLLPHSARENANQTLKCQHLHTKLSFLSKCRNENISRLLLGKAEGQQTAGTRKLCHGRSLDPA